MTNIIVMCLIRINVITRRRNSITIEQFSFCFL